MNQIEHLLVCLSEECAEVSHRVSKALRFGLDEIEPGQDHTNAQRIAQEITDLLAVVVMLEELRVVNRTFDIPAIDRKKAKVRSFMDYARQCGTLDSDDGQAMSVRAVVDRTVAVAPQPVGQVVAGLLTNQIKLLEQLPPVGTFLYTSKQEGGA